MLQYAQDVLKEATDYHEQIQKETEEREYNHQSLLQKAGMEDHSSPSSATNVMIASSIPDTVLSQMDNSEDQSQTTVSDS